MNPRLKGDMSSGFNTLIQNVHVPAQPLKIKNNQLFVFEFRQAIDLVWQQKTLNFYSDFMIISKINTLQKSSAYRVCCCLCKQLCLPRLYGHQTKSLIRQQKTVLYCMSKMSSFLFLFCLAAQTKQSQNEKLQFENYLMMIRHLFPYISTLLFYFSSYSRSLGTH